MIANILAIIFSLKLSSKTHLSAPSFQLLLVYSHKLYIPVMIFQGRFHKENNFCGSFVFFFFLRSITLWLTMVSAGFFFDSEKLFARARVYL